MPTGGWLANGLVVRSYRAGSLDRWMLPEPGAEPSPGSDDSRKRVRFAPSRMRSPPNTKHPDGDEPIGTPWLDAARHPRSNPRVAQRARSDSAGRSRSGSRLRLLRFDHWGTLFASVTSPGDASPWLGWYRRVASLREVQQRHGWSRQQDVGRRELEGGAHQGGSAYVLGRLSFGLDRCRVCRPVRGHADEWDTPPVSTP